MNGILFGLDVGTTKICAIVGEVSEGKLQIIGLGIEPSKGMKKGMVVDVAEASVAIARAVEKAEQTSGYELEKALVSMAGEHLRSINSRGTADIRRSIGGVTANDVERALRTAQFVNIPEDREIVHIVPRYYAIDDHQGIKNPIGMFGSQLELEAHIITASAPALRNLARCTQDVGIKTEEFVLNTLASAESVLEPTEKEMGVIVADIGGGTTDLALYTQGAVWHTDVIALGGWHFTNDIAIGLRVPFEVAEQVKMQYGNCRSADIDPHTTFVVKPFSGEHIEVGLQDLAHVVESRAEELFDIVLKSIKRSGYTGLLPAGIVLTGGGAQLRNITDVAERVLGVSARVARPYNLLGLVDQLQNPAYSTAVGLLRWAANGQNAYRPNRSMQKQPKSRPLWRQLKEMFLPGEVDGGQL